MARSTTPMFVCSVFLGALALLIATGTGCDVTDDTGDGGVADSGTDDDGAGQPDAATLPEGLVSFHPANQSVDLDFSAETEQYVVAAYSISEQVADEIPFTVSVEGTPAGTEEQALSQRRPQPVDPARLARWQARMATERWTRGLMQRATQMRLVSSRSQFIAEGDDCTASAECGELEVCHNKKCTGTPAINMSEFSSPTEPVPTTVKAKGDNVAVLVDDEISGELDLQALVDTFGKKIYPRAAAVFGNPPLTDGGSQLSSDRNGDGLVWLVLTDKVGERDPPAVGFFVATDFVAKDGEDGNPNSNEADILYMLPPGGETQLINLYRIAAHELQHLLGFGSKFYRPVFNGGEGILEALWLDEGQSHFSEDICGFGGENIDLLSNELDDFSSSSMITGTDLEGNPIDTTAMRALALLFVRYLFDQQGGVVHQSDGSISDQGGAAWLAALHTSSVEGRKAIEQTYGSFQQAYDRWMATIVLDARDITSSPLLNYTERFDDPQAPNNPIGLRIRGTFMDSTGTEQVELSGPIETEIGPGDTEDVMASTSGKYYLIKALTGAAKVTVTAEDPDLRFAVVKLQ